MNDDGTNTTCKQEDNHAGIVPQGQSHPQAELSKIIEQAPERDAKYMLGLMPVIADLVRLSQVATYGDPQMLPHLIESPKDFYRNLISEHKNGILGYMMLRSLNKVLTEESNKDPLEHAKLILKIMEAQSTDGAQPKGTPVDSETPSTSDKLIREMEGTGGEPQV